MSQDLLAAFGDFPPQSSKPGSSAQPSNNASSSFSFFDDFGSNGGTSAQAPKAATQSFAPPAVASSGYRDDAAAQGNDDDWGDFEGSAEEPKPEAVPVPVATQFSRWLDEEDDGFPDWEQKTAAPRTGKWDFTKPEPPTQSRSVISQPVKAAPKTVPPPKPRDSNVLFDAEDEPPIDDDDDDFGDFEGADDAVTQPASAELDLLGMESVPKPASQKPEQPSFIQAPTNTSSLLDLEDLTLNDESTNAWKADDAKPPVHSFGTLGPVSTSPAFNQPAAAEPKDSHKPVTQPAHRHKKSASRKIVPKPTSPTPVATNEEEKWDEFEAWEQEAPVQTATKPNLPSIPPALTSESAEPSLSSPPTNIPPPAHVLSLFSPLFASAEASFFKPLRQETSEVQQAIYSEAAAISYLKGLLALATVCGRIIAGRKQRWKRDTILAQSMRIGPSAAGGVSGLKLTSIDKAENSKEEREVADALKAWAGQVGKLKSALAEVKRIRGLEVGKIPELKENIPVRAAKEIEGGLKGNRPCALCGLKREERVLKVDFEVEDSFGEWWVDDVSMHRACVNFWEKHRDTLKQR